MAPSNQLLYSVLLIFFHFRYKHNDSTCTFLPTVTLFIPLEFFSATFFLSVAFYSFRSFVQYTIPVIFTSIPLTIFKTFFFHSSSFYCAMHMQKEIERKRKSNCIQCVCCILFDPLSAFFIFCTF